MSCSYLFNDLDHLTRVAYDEEFQQYWRDLVAEGNNGFQLMSLSPPRRATCTPRSPWTIVRFEGTQNPRHVRPH
jgi:hypothetical protein